MGRMSGKVAVVTGAAQGIGRTYAESLAAEGARVVVTDILDTTEAVDAIKAAGGEAIGLETDVTSDESLAAMVEAAEDAFGPIEVLINNASIFATLTLKPFTEISNDEWDAVMRVNVRGPFQATKAVLPSMKKNGRGKIINISSGTALRGAPMFPHYVSSKGAIIAYTRGLAKEVADQGITVNGVAPGLILETPFHENFNTEAGIQAVINSTPLKTGGTPADVAGAVLYFVSDLGSFITGEVIDINGGLWVS